MNFIFLPIIAVLGFVSAPTLDKAATEFVLGVCGHLFNQGGNQANNKLQIVKKLGLTSVRSVMPWDVVEYAPGRYRIPKKWMHIVDEANKNGINLLVVLAYGNRFHNHGEKPVTFGAAIAFSHYANYVATQLRGKVYGYEIWNEWDGKIGHMRPGDATSYIQLVQAVYPVVKAADPNAKVLVGSVTTKGIKGDYLERLLSMGVLKYGDGLSIHPYIQCSKMSTTQWRRWLHGVDKRATEAAGRDIKIYITEMGWPTGSAKCAVTPSVQAEKLNNVMRNIKYMPYVGGLWWYSLVDMSGSRKLGGFGLMHDLQNPKRAYEALKSFTSATKLPTSSVDH